MYRSGDCVVVFMCMSAHLKERLEEYIKQWNGLVKVFRNEKREGLIQARSIGARKAVKGQVLCLSAAASVSQSQHYLVQVFFHYSRLLHSSSSTQAWLS